MKTMKAVLLDRVTEGKDIILSDVPIPEVRPGWVLVKVRAFGLNHSEKLLRLNEIRGSHIKKPIIPGIECVGEIADPSDSGLAAGQSNCGQPVGRRVPALQGNALVCADFQHQIVAGQGC